MLIFTRKIFIEKLKTGKEKTNTEAVIGEKALVTEEIRPHKTGMVLLVGKTWTAACRNREAVIEKGIEVKVANCFKHRFKPPSRYPLVLFGRRQIGRASCRERV